MQRFVLAALPVLAALLLAGCSSLTGSPGTARLRAVDYLNDDIARMALAFDLPRSLEPMTEGSVLRLDIKTASGAYRHIEAMLERGDASAVAGNFPPPAQGRTYYLYGFSEADKLALRDTQAWARALPAGYLGQGDLKVTLEPRFCAAEAVDPRTVRFSVLLALPRTSLEPLVANQSLADALAAFGNRPVPPCAGHSG